MRLSSEFGTEGAELTRSIRPYGELASDGANSIDPLSTSKRPIWLVSSMEVAAESYLVLTTDYGLNSYLISKGIIALNYNQFRLRVL